MSQRLKFFCCPAIQHEHMSVIGACQKEMSVLVEPDVSDRSLVKVDTLNNPWPLQICNINECHISTHGPHSDPMKDGARRQTCGLHAQRQR